VDVAAVKVTGFWRITICKTVSGDMRYAYCMETEKALWETEGFDSREAMDEWFRPMAQCGEVIEKTLMRFSLLTAPVMARKPAPNDSDS
jgi:hypothetical protein